MCPAGTSVLVMNGAANRDPQRFEEPNEFRLDRPNILHHIAFGRVSTPVRVLRSHAPKYG